MVNPIHQCHRIQKMEQICCRKYRNYNLRLARRHLLSFSCSVVFFLCSADIVQSSDDYAEEIRKSHFPDGFIFGVGTSSYQVEGAYLEDGKGLSIWDVFTHTSGKVKNNENGDIADDHYRRYQEDIEQMQSLGIKAYRFSLSWARILPRGRLGGVNEQGIMFYNNVINNLLLKGIEPFVTIYHNDLPQEMEDRYGGWLSPLIQKDFVYYAEICFRSFGDRVKYWATINEPNFTAETAYLLGIGAPGRCSLPFGNCSVGDSDSEPLIVVHNMLLSHAMAVDLYRQQFQAKQGGNIGLNPQSYMFEPLTDSEEDRISVQRALAFNLEWVLDPLVFGEYPAAMRNILGNQLPRFSSLQKRLIKGSLDFVGINHYTTLYARDCSNVSCPKGGDRPIRGFVGTLGYKNGVPIGDLTGFPGMYVVPWGMEKIIDHISTRYSNIPIYVTENGYCPPIKEHVTMKDLLEDHDRLNFHKAYMAALLRAMRKGADVRGYFIWAWLDAFEWSFGYSARFGLNHVDRQTLERTPKLSAKWYSSFLTNTSHSYHKDGISSVSLRNRNQNTDVSESSKKEIGII